MVIAPVACEHCQDGDGGSVYPYYGLAPHTHNLAGGWIGSTRIDPRDSWPTNFREDPDAPGAGVYLHCPVCGRGDPLPACINSGELA